jgi:hypothetical protein
LGENNGESDLDFYCNSIVRHTWNNQVEETFNELTVWYGRIRYNRSNNEGNLPETIPQGKNVSDMQQKSTRRDLLRIPL